MNIKSEKRDLTRILYALECVYEIEEATEIFERLLAILETKTTEEPVYCLAEIV